MVPHQCGFGLMEGSFKSTSSPDALRIYGRARPLRYPARILFDLKGPLLHTFQGPTSWIIAHKKLADRNRVSKSMFDALPSTRSHQPRSLCHFARYGVDNCLRPPRSHRTSKIIMVKMCKMGILPPKYSEAYNGRAAKQVRPYRDEPPTDTHDFCISKERLFPRHGAR